MPLQSKIVALLAIATAGGWAVAGVAEDPAGMRFRCGELSGPAMCLSVLKSGCSLQLQEGSGPEPSGEEEVDLPANEEEMVVLSCGSQIKHIESADDLQGHVVIASPSDALEYLRFFTSFWTTQFFTERKLEIRVGQPETCFSSCLPQERWLELGLEAPEVVLTEGGFKVSRPVILPIPHPQMVSAYRIEEKVTFDGKVELLSQVEIPLTLEDRGRLFFEGRL